METECGITHSINSASPREDESGSDSENDAVTDTETWTWKMSRSGHMRKPESSREYVNITRELGGISFQRSREAVRKIGKEVIPEINACLDTRFDSFNSVNSFSIWPG